MPPTALRRAPPPKQTIRLACRWPSRMISATATSQATRQRSSCILTLRSFRSAVLRAHSSQHLVCFIRPSLGTISAAPVLHGRPKHKPYSESRTFASGLSGIDSGVGSLQGLCTEISLLNLSPMRIKTPSLVVCAAASAEQCQGPDEWEEVDAGASLNAR